MSGSSPGFIQNQVPTPAQWNGYFAGKLDGGVIAVSASGTTQATATPLTSQNVVITACASGAGVMATLGYHKLYNRSVNACLFYPVSGAGANFEALATNAPVSIPVSGSVTLFMISATQGYVG